MNTRPLPASPIEETVRSLGAWRDGELWDLARAVGVELARRRLPTPVGLPIAAAMAGLNSQYPAPSGQY